MKRFLWPLNAICQTIYNLLSRKYNKESGVSQSPPQPNDKITSDEKKRSLKATAEEQALLDWLNGGDC